MNAPLLVVAGTGTGIGKTTIATALVLALARRCPSVAGLKPVETGVPPGAPETIANTITDAVPDAALAITDTVSTNGISDGARLGQASTFHVKHPAPYLFMDAVSPHLAARREARTIVLDRITTWVAPIRSKAHAVVLELPGGLFSPLNERETNADLLRHLAPTRTILVAPDRLGVLHDVLSTTHAARAHALHLDAVALSAPEPPDTSTGTNAAELARLIPAPPVLATFPRATGDLLVERAAALVQELRLF